MSRFADLVDYFLPPPKLKLVARSPWWAAYVPESVFACMRRPRTAVSVEDWIALLFSAGVRRFRIYEGAPSFLVLRVPYEFVPMVRLAAAVCHTPAATHVSVEALPRPLRCALGLHPWIRWYGAIRAPLPKSSVVDFDLDRCSRCPQLRARARRVEERVPS